ncbi:hypothetical protein ACFW42_08445 [Streptomyces albidoflavus]
MTRTKRLAAALAGTAAVLGAAVAPVQASGASGTLGTTGAQACYDQAFGYTAQAGANGDYAHYPNYNQWTYVAGFCNDINIKTNASRTVRVCTVNKCHGWVSAPKPFPSGNFPLWNSASA